MRGPVPTDRTIRVMSVVLALAVAAVLFWIGFKVIELGNDAAASRTDRSELRQVNEAQDDALAEANRLLAEEGIDPVPVPEPAPASGPSGPQGQTGPEGPTGPRGLPGVIGPAGPMGQIGATGPAGPAGATGAEGAQGPAGAPGPAGADGAPGAPGADSTVPGPTGPAGAVGPAGSVNSGTYNCGADEYLAGLTVGAGGTLALRCEPLPKIVPGKP